jgi:N-acetylmuramoyl-L-alanine amidase
MRNLLVLALAIPPGLAGAVDVMNVRMWPAPGTTRVVFDVSAPVDYKLFTMSNPDRIVCDIEDARAPLALRLPLDDPNIVAGLRYAPRGDGLRLVLDLRRPVDIEQIVLPPREQYGHRLVIDLVERGAQRTPAVVAAPAPGVLRDLVVAIDAGHGGEDVGAIGPAGTYEKDVTLAVARELKSLIDAQPGLQAVLIRDGDYYVGLRNRMARAREQQADLFISLHADAFRDPKVSGSSVYVLSQNGASSEAARWLADKANSSDLIGGLTLSDKDEVLKSVLLDLSQTAAIDGSINAADRVLASLAAVGKVHRRHVERAGFAVLKSPDVPSMLVEMAFISNPSEEKRLADAAFRRRIAQAIRGGVVDYFHEYAPPGTLLAQREQRVEPGDTVSEIARRYAVSAGTLTAVNSLSGDTIKVGDGLRIP